MNHVIAPVSATVPAPLDLHGPIARDLEEVERILQREMRSRHPRVAEVLDHVRHYRGKRLRPVLVLLSARACGSVRPAHHVLAAVVEMIHTATLVHDDVLDNATVRRHVRTINAGWGTQASILLGDHLFTHAFHLASTLGDARVCRIIGEATNKVCAGELRQGLEKGNLELSEADYYEIIEGKTAELIACCCQLGALYAEASETTVAGMTRYGRHLGIAFQIADDLLDLTGEEQQTGKSLGTDLEQQKLTLPLIHWFASQPASTVTRVQQLLTSPSNHKHAAILPLLVESGSMAYARTRALEHAAQARAELTCLSPSPYRTILETMSEQVVQRNH